jgi:hypothetical protein
MSEEEIAALHERVYEMEESERLRLDPVAKALEDWLRVEADRRRIGFIVSNRVAALAVIDAMKVWEKKSWERG